MTNIFNNIRKFTFLFIALLFITSCTTKSKSIEIIQTIKEDIKKVENKINVVEKEYKQLIITKPECINEIIINNIETLKSDVSNLSNKIKITEYLVEAEIKTYQQEIKSIKLINIILKTILFILSIGVILFLIKR